MRTKARDVLLLLLVYVVLFAVGSVFYVLCFRTPLFNGMTVFFYRASPSSFSGAASSPWP